MLLVSGSERAHRPKGLIAGLEPQSLLHLVGDEFSVFSEIGEALDSALPAGHLDHLEAVVKTVAAAHAREGAAKDAVLDAAGAVFAGLAGLAQFAVDAEWRAEGPAAGITVEVGEAARLDRVPLVDAHRSIAGRVAAPVALAAFLEEIHGSALS